MNPLLIRRRGMMMSKSLPYDAEVEYLQGSGTQFINTGIIATEATDIKVQLSDNSVVNRWIFGARVGFNNNALGMFCTNNAVNKWQVTRRNVTTQEFTFTTDSQYGISTFELTTSDTFVGTRGSFTATLNITGGSGTLNTSVPIYLFCINNNGVASSKASINIHGCEIYENNVLQIDLIPVRVGTVGYMYDRVSGQLFGNAGTGAFVLGPDVQ